MRHFIKLLIVFLFYSCTEKNNAEFVKFTTASDSTKYYYNLGWKQIMDDGDYSGAEVSYRKALSFDPDFLVGQSILARITLDDEERLTIYNRLESEKHNVVGDEQLILEVYTALTKYTNLREQNHPETRTALQEAFDIGEDNLGKIVHKYPKEVYLKSEYIEVLHAKYGAEQTLDSIAILVTGEQQKNPFLLGYKAILTAEIGKYDEALDYAKELKEIINDVTVAKPDAVFADIYFKMKDYKIAKVHADRANSIDPRNLDASRLKTRIDAELQKLD